MRRPYEAWYRHLALWVPPLALVLVGLGLLLVYRVAFVGELQLGGEALERQSAEVAQVEAERQAVEALVSRAEENRRKIGAFYGENLATERERLTETIAELKDLGRRSGLEPTVIRYPDEFLEDYGLVKRSMVFGVNGSYIQLRRFVNFLELSEKFLTLEEIGLSGQGEGKDLRIGLRVSTLFRHEGGAPVSSEPAEVSAP